MTQITLTAPAKRRSGDLWGIVKIDEFGQEKRVQIGGWESSTFPFKSQAEKYARGLTKNEVEIRKGTGRYEARYAGNWKTKEGPGHWWV